MSTYATITLAVVFALPVTQQATEKESPAELEVIKQTVGVWDAEIEVWSQGLDSPPIKFTGVETNKAFGTHWIVSDFESEYMGQTMLIHSIIGYDIDKKQLVGKQVDSGPYAASMTGEYDASTKTITWTTRVKGLNGEPMVQSTTLTQVSEKERRLTLKMPSGEEGKMQKFMSIKFIKRK